MRLSSRVRERGKRFYVARHVSRGMVILSDEAGSEKSFISAFIKVLQYILAGRGEESCTFLGKVPTLKSQVIYIA